MTFDYGPLHKDSGELGAVAEILSWAFNFPAADAEPWLASAGLENLRVLREGKRPIACLILLPMGQYFGGHRVPMVGVAGVATAADRRGSGAATELMRAAVRELHASGVPISVLYPATRPLYRRAGYEPAGSRMELSVPINKIGIKDRTLTVRPVQEADHEAIEKLYQEHAVSLPGHLDRSSYIWRRVRSPRGQTARGFVIERVGRIDGYVYLYEKVVEPMFYDVYVTDAVARSPEATRRLLGFLGDHGTNGRNVVWRTGAADSLVQALPEVGFETTCHDHWMLRIVDIKRALTERGYLDGLTDEIHFDVRDDLIPENQGRFVLSIAGGQGKVRKGGKGRLGLDVRGLAALFTGHVPPASLAVTGLLDGPAAEMHKAAAIFSGPAPWMPDFF